MSQDHFLAFKGLKQYTPDAGWESLHDQDQRDFHHPSASLGAQTVGPQSHQDFIQTRAPQVLSDFAPPAGTTQAVSAPRSTAQNTAQTPRAQSDDPLISELFDQLRHPIEDELSKNWKVIAANVNTLSQRLEQQKSLKAQLSALEAETDVLRAQILDHLEDVQRTAERQLSVARLRIEVSSLARNKLSDKLRRS